MEKKTKKRNNQTTCMHEILNTETKASVSHLILVPVRGDPFIRGHPVHNLQSTEKYLAIFFSERPKLPPYVLIDGGRTRVQYIIFKGVTKDSFNDKG